MKKIIGFDSWTGGAHHYQRLLTVLASRSIQFNLVHIGSWGNEPGCPHESRQGNLLMRDIRFYGGDSFEKILDIEQPDAVVLLSTDTFAHRAVIRYCNKRSIPTLNLYHGLVNVQDTAGEMGSPAISNEAHLKYVFSKMGKLLQHTLPCYVKALLHTNAALKDWSRFILDIFSLATGSNRFGRAADDAKTTKCAVYVQADVEHAMRRYGFTEDDVFVVGNPDFLQFGLEESMIGQWLPPAKGCKKSIMYIETGFSSVGLCYQGTEGFIHHLIETSLSLAAQGYKMLLKLKPHQVNVTIIEKGLAGTQIQLVKNDNFLQILMKCSACIVETTSLAMLPTLMGMPLLLAQYGNLKSLSYGSVLTSYPKSYFLEDITSVGRILADDEKSLNRTQLNDWINFNVGPLPPNKMPDRVVDIINNMVVEQQTTALC